MTTMLVRRAFAAAALFAFSTTAVLAQGGSSAFPTPGQPVPQNNGTSSNNGNASTPTTMHHRHHHHHHMTTQTPASTDTTTPPPDQSGAPH